MNKIFGVVLMLLLGFSVRGYSSDEFNCDDYTYTRTGGVCHFQTIIMDKAIAIDDIWVDNFYPAVNQHSYAKAIRVYFSEMSFEDISYSTKTYQDLLVDDYDGAPVNSVINGLESNKKYYFRAAIVTQNGQVTNMTGLETIYLVDGCKPNDNSKCPMVATVK